MFSLKTCSGFVSKFVKLAPSRHIFLSCRKQLDDEWRSTNTTNQTEDENTSMGVSVEKTINSVTLLGRVGSNPVKRGSPEHPVVTFSLATNSNYSYANGDITQKTEWHRICVFKPYLRESTLKYTNKGQRVLIQGRIIYGEVREPEGQLRHTSSIVADDVIFFKSG
ncbi:single-stranded DNA-binding protein, mitochondrial-like [Daphnia carinata]|uniref:single-stranded DNA-binding protein, mitochondrial-like n=1 Tax=Daphnia carinata TaxID=120202 RepID=UPI00257F12FF|nr:single-stranded DNA-binding protein, mitochondrial-like [Daphnia carinata]